MKLSKPVLIALSLLLGFAAGAWMPVNFGSSSSDVVANITNDSDEVVDVVIKFETCGGKGLTPVGSIEPGTSREVHYHVCGEAGYLIEARFKDGRTVTGREAYVESGYVTKDKIGALEISSTQSPYRRVS